MVQRKASQDAGEDAPVPSLVSRVLQSSGEALSDRTRQWVEPRMGLDLSNVRVHTDERAARSARAVDALAYTSGRHIVFGRGQYAPETDSGRRLLGHELVHVAQQAAGSPGLPAPKTLDPPNHPREAEADRVADALMSNSLSPSWSIGTTAAMHLTILELSCMRGLVPSAGYQVPTTTERQDYENRFGLPPRVSGGYRNRLDSKVYRTQGEALMREARSLSGRRRASSSIGAASSSPSTTRTVTSSTPSGWATRRSSRNRTATTRARRCATARFACPGSLRQRPTRSRISTRCSAWRDERGRPDADPAFRLRVHGGVRSGHRQPARELASARRAGVNGRLQRSPVQLARLGRHGRGRPFLSNGTV